MKCFAVCTAYSRRHSERAQEPALTLPASIEKNKDTSHEKEEGGEKIDRILTFGSPNQTRFKESTPLAAATELACAAGLPPERASRYRMSFPLKHGPEPSTIG